MRTRVGRMPSAWAWLSPICIRVSWRQSARVSSRAASAKGATVSTDSRLEAARDPKFQKRNCSSTTRLESSRKLERPPKVAERATPTRMSLRGLERPTMRPRPSTMRLPSRAPMPDQSR